MGGTALLENVLCFFPRQISSNDCCDQDNGSRPDKQPFKCVKNCACNGNFRVTEIPTQVRTIDDH